MQDRLKRLLKILKIATISGTGGLFVFYHIRNTYKALSSIVNHNVLDLQKKHTPEYIYMDDPSYNVTLKIEQDREIKQSGFFRLWKSLKHSLAWRLLWLCRHGNYEQRNIALEQLASFKNNKHWDCVKLAQAMDMNTAVLLARTRGADLRYFLPPPLHVRRAATQPTLMSFTFRDMISAVESINSHSCIQHFLAKNFANVQEQAMDAEHVPAKPDSISERDLCILCLDALHHHISLYYGDTYQEDESSVLLIKLGLLPKLAELMLRNRNDSDLDYAVLRVLTVLTVYKNLLKDFFQNGLIRELSRLLRSNDIRLASSAAVCLANLSGEFSYKPGLYLLHPLYRSKTTHKCDTLLVHGLRGGVFVTWRQRDKKCAEPIGIIEVTMSDNDCDSCEDENPTSYLDPELKQVIEDLKVLEEQTLLADYEVVLHDVPLEAKRDSINMEYIIDRKLQALTEEVQDYCHHTHCWPKEWLPQDCENLRILGVNYWSSLSEWLERCPQQSAEIASKALELGPQLKAAGVGRKDTPIVWLAHSMGGLIVKQILIEAAQSGEQENKKICDNTKAILFFSTPHTGSSLAKMPRPAAAVLWPSNDVRQLEENSPVLLELQHNFITFADLYDWETISFAETLPTLITAFKVPVHFVEARSADVGRGVFYRLPLDHLTICKPATRQSIIYRTVLDVIKRATTKDMELKHAHTFLQWLINILLWLLSYTNIETIDETHGTDGLKWFERLLLETFSDF